HSMEKEHELDLARTRATQNDENRSPLPSVTSNGGGNISLDTLIKGVEILTIPVPRKTESWNLFFNSLARAYKPKKIPEEFQAEILLKVLGDKASNFLVYIKEEDLKDYAKVKTLILKEFEPTPQACLENFRNAKRNSGDTHIQFISRLTSTWKYCKSRMVEDYESQKDLIISDKLFQAFDSHTASHILNSGNNLFNNVDTLIAVTDELNVSCLITPGIYELLVHSADNIFHLFDDELNNERKVLTLHSEAKRRETESFYPQQPSEDAEKEEKSAQPIEVRLGDVSPSTRTKAKSSETLKNADDVTISTGARKLREEQRQCQSLKEAFLQCKAKKGNYLFIYGLLHHTDKIFGQPV
ncbi:hypothetical protein AVEN_118991-1, partial [Araneus ventricosus]